MTDQTDSSTGIRSLFSELRRRRVLRTSAIYVAASWVLLQVVNVVFPIFDIEDAYQKYVTIGMVIGFPVAVVLSWLFNIDLGHVTRDRSGGQPASGISEHDPDFKTRMKELPLRSVAVMPFANVGGAEENEFFSDGIAEELINLLSKSQGLNVAARTSSFSFRNSESTVQQIALRLGVRHVLEGGVRREGSRVRISVQLIDALTGFQAWSSSYDRELTDIFAVQDEISSSIVYALSAAIDQTIGGTQSLRVDAPTDNIEAYQLYLRGMYLWQRRGASAIGAAIGALQQAIEADPDYVDAISLLAVATAVMHEYTGTDRELDFDQAEALASRAMELAPETSMAHAVHGYIAMRRWQWTKSETHFLDALRCDGSEPLVHQWYSNLLNDLGRQEAALAHALKAYQADRLSPQANNILALNFLLLGDDASAIKHVAVAREFGLGGAVPDWVEYFVRLRENNYPAAVDIMAGSLKRKQAVTEWVQPTVNAIADRSTLEGALEKIAATLEEGGLGKSLAFMQYVLLVANDQVFDLALTMVDDHSLIHLWLFLPEAAALRADPRFDTLMESMGINDYWETNGRPAIAERARATA